MRLKIYLFIEKRQQRRRLCSPLSLSPSARSSQFSFLHFSIQSIAIRGDIPMCSHEFNQIVFYVFDVATNRCCSTFGSISSFTLAPSPLRRLPLGPLALSPVTRMFSAIKCNDHSLGRPCSCECKPFDVGSFDGSTTAKHSNQTMLLASSSPGRWNPCSVWLLTRRIAAVEKVGFRYSKKCARGSPDYFEGAHINQLNRNKK